jgi:hypothetical protein
VGCTDPGGHAGAIRESCIWDPSGAENFELAPGFLGNVVYPCVYMYSLARVAGSSAARAVLKSGVFIAGRKCGLSVATCFLYFEL